MALERTVIVVLDGFDPAYLAVTTLPTFEALVEHGSFTFVQAVLPSVTNVNHAAIATGGWPRDTGIASNYRFDRSTRSGTFVETAEFLRLPTILEKIAERGGRPALITSKAKLLRFLGRGVTLAVTAEHPPPELVRRLGEPPPIYSSEIDEWTLRAARLLLDAEQPDLLYCTTTDYTFHQWPPDAPEAHRYLRRIDACIGELLAAAPDYRIVITADHGMNQKTRAIDPTLALAPYGIEATFVPPIKDRYIVHHQNMGGAGYLFIHHGSPSHARDILLTLPGIEAIYEADEAVRKFRLPREAVGDLFLLADRETVFAPAGTFPTVVTAIQLRSHGSQHETRVPMWGWQIDVSRAASNADLASLLALGPETDHATR